MLPTDAGESSQAAPGERDAFLAVLGRHLKQPLLSAALARGFAGASGTLAGRVARSKEAVDAQIDGAAQAKARASAKSTAKAKAKATAKAKVKAKAKAKTKAQGSSRD